MASNSLHPFGGVQSKVLRTTEAMGNAFDLIQPYATDVSGRTLNQQECLAHAIAEWAIQIIRTAVKSDIQRQALMERIRERCGADTAEWFQARLADLDKPNK